MFDAFSQNFHFYYYGKSNKNQLFSDRKKELLSLVCVGGEESEVLVSGMTGSNSSSYICREFSAVFSNV